MLNFFNLQHYAGFQQCQKTTCWKICIVRTLTFESPKYYYWRSCPVNQYVKLIEIVEQKPTTPKRENTLVEKEELDTRVVFYGMTEDADEQLPEYRVSAHKIS